LHLEDVQPAEACRVDAVCALVFVAVSTPNPLVSTRTERPTAVLGRWAVPREQHTSDVWTHPCVVENSVELVDRVRSERVSHLGSAERYTHSSDFVCPVIGDIGEFEAGHRLPR